MRKPLYYILGDKVVESPSKEEIEKVPIEQRVEIYKGKIENMVFESWWIDMDKQTTLDFCYLQENESECVPLSIRRNDFFRKHNIYPEYLRSYILPPENFTDKGVKIPNE